MNTLSTEASCHVSREYVEVISNNIMLLRQVCQAGRRPYIHPLRALDGIGVLSEDSPDHHPWQHGLYTGLHGVNGSDFWFDQGEQVGRIEIQDSTAVSDQSWSLNTLWRHHQGHELLNESQQWSLSCGADYWTLDLTWSLQACCDIHIEQCSYGGLFLRMPFTKDKHVHVVNSNEQCNDDCEQAAADWVAIEMDIDERDEPAGIAFMAHPQNQAEQTRWRVDHQRGINPSPCIEHALDIAHAQCRSWNYRLIIFAGHINSSLIKQEFIKFAQEE